MKRRTKPAAKLTARERAIRSNERRRARRQLSALSDAHLRQVAALQRQIDFLAAEVRNTTGKVWAGYFMDCPMWIDRSLAPGEVRIISSHVERGPAPPLAEGEPGRGAA